MPKKAWAAYFMSMMGGADRARRMWD